MKGLAIAGLAAFLAVWETIAIADGDGGIPTISRCVQGLRDTGRLGSEIVVAITTFLVIVIGAFVLWLVPHFVRSRRSSL